MVSLFFFSSTQQADGQQPQAPGDGPQDEAFDPHFIGDMGGHG